MSDRNWAHRLEFDPSAMEEFGVRLGRARATGRAQYLRVKAAVLLEHAEPAGLPIAIGLLKRVVEEYDDILQVPSSHELLGRAYRQLGDLATGIAKAMSELPTATTPALPPGPLRRRSANKSHLRRASSNRRNSHWRRIRTLSKDQRVVGEDPMFSPAERVWHFLDGASIATE